MTSILITGMSGTGKSTVISILHQRGYAVAETDEPGWCVPKNGDWSSPDYSWVWDETRIAQLLDDHHSTHLFVDGCRSNQGRFYDRFDHIVLLTAPIETILERVKSRDNNPFGGTAAQREQITQDKLEFEPMLMRGADIVIDTSESAPEQIAGRLEMLL